MFSFLTRAILLPVDMVLLTADFLRMLFWLARRGLWRIIGSSYAPSFPCTDFTRAVSRADGGEVPLCMPAANYANLFVARLLCPCAGRRVHEARDSICASVRQRGFLVPKLRFAVVGFALAAVWFCIARTAVSAAGHLYANAVAPAAHELRPGLPRGGADARAVAPTGGSAPVRGGAQGR